MWVEEVSQHPDLGLQLVHTGDLQPILVHVPLQVQLQLLGVPK